MKSVTSAKSHRAPPGAPRQQADVARAPFFTTAGLHDGGEEPVVKAHLLGAGALAGGNQDRVGLVHRRAERLIGIDVLAGGQGTDDLSAMELRRCRNIDHIDVLSGQQIGVALGSKLKSERFFQPLRFVQVGITNSDQLDPEGEIVVEQRHVQVVVGMGMPHKSRADDADPELSLFHGAPPVPEYPK